jgi:hypothetical protein
VDLLPVAEHVRPWPHLGQRCADPVRRRRGRAAAQHGLPVDDASQRLGGAGQRGALVGGGTRHVGQRRVGVPRVSERARHVQAELSAGSRQDGHLVRQDARPVLAGVHFDEHPQPGDGVRQPRRGLGAVYASQQVGPVAQRRQPGGAVAGSRPERVGDEDARTAVGREEFCLKKRRDGEPDGSA